MSNEVTKYEENIGNIISYVKNFNAISNENFKFLQDNKEHLGKMFEKVHMWRTTAQKESIISDEYHPTTHSKFHQTIAEAKVQTEYLFYTMKDFEIKKLEIEELSLDIEEIEDKEKESLLSGIERKRLEIQKNKKQIEIQFKTYELKQMEIAMHYRMDEVKDWKRIQDRLITQLKKEGMDDESIWEKGKGEIESMFLQFLYNFRVGIERSQDGAERANLHALAQFSIKQAKEAGLFEILLKRCNKLHIEALQMLGEVEIIDATTIKVKNK